MSTERPILFSGEMVRAILAGRKTQTRRVVKPQPAEVHHCQDRDSYPFEMTYEEQDGKTVAVVKYTMGEIEAHFCPYGQPGDRLWVREKHSKLLSAGAEQYTVFPEDVGGGQKWSNGDFYPAPAKGYFPGAFDHIKWRPSIFMPRWASRITLEITGVRVERVQDISEEDAKAEGCEIYCAYFGKCYSGRCASHHYRKGYRVLWDSINAKRGFPWSKNPWVWLIEFKKL